MPLRMSSLFVRSLKEDPADAEVASHRLLHRAGYIRRSAPGIYTWLPLGLRAMRKIEDVIREEMNAIGGQEMLFPALLPREPYETSNRWTEYGDNLFRLQDRRGNDYLLAPTHEEMFTLLVKDLYSSYKDLPAYLYQIQTKYRDEARPRAGLLRGREFIMKDSYSFTVDDAGLDAAYEAHRAAYLRIFDRLPGECFRHLPRLLVRLIVSDRSGDDWTDCLHSIIDGQFDVDRLDYLMRDGSRAGTELGWEDRDDLNDLPMLRAAREAGGIAVAMGERDMPADVHLPGPAALALWLERRLAA